MDGIVAFPEPVLEVVIPCGIGAVLVHPLGPGEFFAEVRGWDETIPSEFFPPEEMRVPTWDEAELGLSKLTGGR